jgi:deazaflavin-dependent oxidoreductase (nitroreductase family)
MADPNVDFNAGVIAEFRANGGKLGGPFAGAPLVLLTTTGAKTGRRLTTPLMYTTDGDRVVVIASKGGAPTSPGWYHNLVANPKVTVEIGGESFEANAVVPTGAERDRLYSQQAEQYPQFAEYQANTTRTIPVVALGRVR